VVSAGAASVERSSAQTRRIPASTTLRECAVRPRVGSRGPSLWSGVARQRRPTCFRPSDATVGFSTKRSGGDARR
jgi:hypothetical protein